MANRIVIILEGGLVQNVLSDGEPVNYAVVDYDTEGVGDDEITMIPQDSGSEADAVCRTDVTEVNEDWVKEVFTAITANEIEEVN